MEVVRQIAEVPTAADMTGKPRIPVQVFDCGEVENELELRDGDSEEEGETNNAFIQYQRRREAKLKEKEQKKLAKVADKPSDGEEAGEENKDGGAALQAELVEQLRNPGKAREIRADPVAQRRAELQLKMNQAMKLNNKAVIEEQERLNDPMYEKRKTKEEFFKDQRLSERDLE